MRASNPPRPGPSCSGAPKLRIRSSTFPVFGNQAQGSQGPPEPARRPHQRRGRGDGEATGLGGGLRLGLPIGRGLPQGQLPYLAGFIGRGSHPNPTRARGRGFGSSGDGASALSGRGLRFHRKGTSAAPERGFPLFRERDFVSAVGLTLVPVGGIFFACGDWNLTGERPGRDWRPGLREKGRPWGPPLDCRRWRCAA